MFTEIVSPESPPPYTEAVDAADDILEPTILVLSGQSIHATSADSALLYQVDLGIANLSRLTTEVEFERIERAVKTGADGEPVIKPRLRHIYNLRCSRPSPWTSEILPSSDTPLYCIAAVSRRTLGNIGIKKSRFKEHWKALPIDTSAKSSNHGSPMFVKDAKPLFEVHHRDDTYEWVDDAGNALAVEDEKDDQHRLLVTASLHRQTMDALVALWCCRVWQYSADHKEPLHEGMEGIRRNLRMGKGTVAPGFM